jgi:long-chain acyl-CoA synthetase
MKGETMAVSDAAAQLARLGDTTFPRLLAKHAAERPSAPALREKDLGIWQAMSWAELKAEVEVVAAGLAAAGFERGMKLALIGENRPRLYIGMIAAQVLGGVPVPLYQDAVAQEMVYVFRDAGIGFAIVEDQEQVDKLLEVRREHPDLRAIYYDDPRGLRNYEEPGLASYDSLLEAGRTRLAADPGLFDREVAAGSPADPAAIFYTSGTTGNPKGVVHGHNNLISVSDAASRLEKLGPDDDVLAYLPMAWLGQNIFSYTQWLVNGFTVNCPESDETVASDMREIGPTYYFAPPRVLEALLTQVTIRMEDAAPIKQRMFRYFLDVAKRVGERLLERDASVGFMDRLLYRIGDLTVYGPLRNALGMSKLRVAYTAGEAIGPDLFVFFRSIGINLKQLYGSTETAVFVCIQPDGRVRADTVGVPLDGVEVSVSDTGELLIRSPGLLREYHNNPAATAEVKDADGWYHTGDAGYFDTDGQLKIIDRAKDVGKLADGSMFAPKYIENKLKFFPYVKEAVAFGDGTDRVMAMLNIDYEACGNYAERRNIPYAGYVDLASRPEIGKLMAECVEQVNADLAADPMMSASQIHRFLVLHKELDADDGELTRTRKVRRRFIGEKYATLVDALYDGSDHCFIETQVRFEDGRTGSVSADIRIVEAKVFPPAAATRAA